MKKYISRTLTFALILFGLWGGTIYAAENLNIGTMKSGGTQLNNNNAFSIFESDDFFTISTTGEKGAYYFLVKVAHDLKNLFFVFATVFYMVIVLKVLVAEKTEESVEKFKKGIIWITVGIAVMQLAYVFTKILYDKTVDATLGFYFLDNFIDPLIGLLTTLVSFIFIAVAIYAFYRIITANGDEEKVKKAKQSILYALVGFIIVRFARTIVEIVYGKINCGTSSCLETAKLSDAASLIVTVINWLNSFVGIVVIIMVLYAGFLVLISAGDDEKLKKAKSSLLYIVIGLFILVVNYLLLTFFILPESAI